AALAFGEVVVGQQSPAQTVMVTAGSASLRLEAKSSSPAFVLTIRCPATLASGEPCKLDVVFAPTATGVQRGTLSLSLPGGKSLKTALSGNGQPPPTVPVLAPAALAFGEVVVGQQSPAQTVMVTAG